jgi:hypothetical protein
LGVLHPVDPNAHYRARRNKQRRRRRVRRVTAVVFAVLAAAALAYTARIVRDDEQAAKQPERAAAVAVQGPKQVIKPLEPPKVMRGVHVTMALASIPGKLDEYLSLDGLNTIQLDVKDENGEVGFVPSAVPLARQIGAAKPYYKPRQVARRIHDRGKYLIGRVVVMEDPVLSEQRPDLAILRKDGGRWTNHAGLGWSNPYDRRVWDYNVDIAEVAARTGFDEIQFDYVRFPSDGDIESAIFPGKRNEAMGVTIARFVHYATKRLKPMGVRVSVDVFGLSATRDLGIGQSPRRLAKIVDAIYPMVYPSHYGSGEYGIDSPVSSPRRTVGMSLRDFRRQMRRGKADLIPWLEDFSFSGTTTLEHVQEQIRAARRWKSGGFLLWNPSGIYTEGALTAQ